VQNLSGRKIKAFRIARQPPMSQAALAHALQLRGMNVDRAGVAKIEGGFRQVSDVELVAIAETLSVSPGDLLDAGAQRSSDINGSSK